MNLRLGLVSGFLAGASWLAVGCGSDDTSSDGASWDPRGSVGVSGPEWPEPPLPGASVDAVPPTLPEAPPRANPFTRVAHDPLSTFAADVDTASYDIFVRDIGYGHLPAPETVRTEEFVNYFSYAYPAPAADAAHPFSISLAAAPSIFADGTLTVRVGIQATKPPPFEKKPTNLVFLVDVSGSMQSPEKLPLAQLVLHQALDVLSPSDVLSIVTYASGTEVVLPPTPAGDRSTVEPAIDGLAAGGGTNGAGGIQLAYDQARAGFIEGGINHVVLCTDGDFNIGISSTTELVEFITEKRRTGVTLTALGFGSGGPNDAMMEAVTNAGNGMYGVIANEAQATRYVEDRLLATMTHVAKDMKIQVEWNPEQVEAYRLIGYENRAIADSDFRNDIVDAGEVGAGHRVTALYQVVLPGREIPAPEGAATIADGPIYEGPREVTAGDLVLVKVRYKNVDAAETDPAFEVAAAIPVSQVHGELQAADPDLRWAIGVAGLSEILRQSPFAKPALIGSIGALVDASAGTDPDRVELQRLFGQTRSLLGQ